MTLILVLMVSKLCVSYFSKVTLLFIVLPPMGLSISAVGSTEVGQSLYITCTVTVVEGLVVQPTVEWVKMDDISLGDINDLNIPSVTVIDGGMTNITIVLEPVKFEHRGIYYCMGMFNVSGTTNDAQAESDVFNLMVDCKCLHIFISGFNYFI